MKLEGDNLRLALTLVPLLGASCMVNRCAEASKNEPTALSSGPTDDPVAWNAYNERCVYTQGENHFDVTQNCQGLDERLAKDLNARIREIQGKGVLKELEPFEFCPQFHWLEGKPHTRTHMIGAPGPHSHFKVGDLDCVSGVYVYTKDTGTVACNLSSICVDGEGEREQLSSVKAEACDLKFDVTAAIDQLQNDLGEKLASVVK